MNTRKLASKILVTVLLVMGASALSGCVVYTRPAPARYYYWHR